ncbi:arabinogalactan endo-beta-1,4-galactanase [Coleophoma cylindrospora]|uniref:Arabinogalactan endo-beta-1,4-galactanase n=1 Tax=Coleophoma cylindrospora TaxID=1849047 RepID=A0A3D8S1Z8_9HELO|nr:arabinogalactan endo-beta-1,4-galactanase [Coleophoma cylindrospora]
MLSALTFVSVLAASAHAALTYKGADWSSTIVEENSGIKWSSTSGTTTALETLLADNGVNTVRQRLWTGTGDYDLAYNIKLGARAHAAGMGIYLDMHFSDTWADTGHQTLPSGWPTDMADLTYTLYNYTKSVCNEFAANSIPLSIVSIGNEITNGLLWPTGVSSDMYNVASLLHSAAWGIKDSNLATIPKILIHTDNGWDWTTQEWFYSTILSESILVSSDFDMIGLSYYPFYNSAATLSALKTSMTNLASTYGKELVIAETDWPEQCTSPAYSFPSDASSIPFSAAGQTTWLEDVAAVVAGVSKGVGLFYWEPAWVDNASLGSSCEDNCMFDYSGGKARSSLAAFKSI